MSRLLPRDGAVAPAHAEPLGCDVKYGADLLTKFHLVWVMTGGPAALIVDADTSGGAARINRKTQIGPLTANGSEMNATGRRPTFEHHASTIWEVVKDAQPPPGGVTILRVLGGVSGRPLMVGLTVDRAVRTYGHATSRLPRPSGVPSPCSRC